MALTAESFCRRYLIERHSGNNGYRAGLELGVGVWGRSPRGLSRGDFLALRLKRTDVLPKYAFSPTSAVLRW